MPCLRRPGGASDGVGVGSRSRCSRRRLRRRCCSRPAARGQSRQARGRSRDTRAPPGSRVFPALAALPGADTSLLIWPAAVKPIAICALRRGKALGRTAPCHPNPARIVNLDTGRSVVRPIPGLAQGWIDLLAVGHWLVYNSTEGVAVIRSDLRGAPRIIGHADAAGPLFVPGVNDQVWLVDRILYPGRTKGPVERGDERAERVCAEWYARPQARATEGHIRSGRGHRPRAAAVRRHATELSPGAVETRLPPSHPRQ